MHRRHLTEELRTVSREEEILGKVVGCVSDGFLLGVLSTVGGAVPVPLPCSQSHPEVPEIRVSHRKAFSPIHGSASR